MLKLYSHIYESIETFSFDPVMLLHPMHKVPNWMLAIYRRRPSFIKMEIRKAFIPLYVVSKVLCISPFSLKNLQSSKIGTIVTIIQAISYTIFHFWMANRDMSNESSSKKLVGILIIDSYNRYSGFCTFGALVIATIAMQSKIVRAIKLLESIDAIFKQEFNLIVDNWTWRRWTNNLLILIIYANSMESNWFLAIYKMFPFIRNVCLQVCFFITALSILECCNCLMYIQESVSFSYYCLIMCLGKKFSRNLILYIHWISLENVILLYFIKLYFSSDVCYWHHRNTIHQLSAIDTQSTQNVKWAAQ